MPKFSRIARHRSLAFIEQGGLCCYCRLRMFLGNLDEIANQLGTSKRAAFLVRSTAEHLVSREDGGTGSRHNIAAAHWYCNRQRHRLANVPSPNSFAQYVQRRLELGKWWTKAIFRALVTQASRSQ